MDDEVYKKHFIKEQKKQKNKVIYTFLWQSHIYVDQFPAINWINFIFDIIIMLNKNDFKWAKPFE